MSAAGRTQDFHACPSHKGGPLEGNARQLRINSEVAARAGDSALCEGPRDRIVTGSATVRFNGRAASRVGSRTMHGGALLIGSGNVRVGGPAAGTTVGSPHRGEKMCHALGPGRHPPPGTVYPAGHPRAGQPILPSGTRQSYNNCGVETSRAVVQEATGKEISEDAMLDSHLDDGLARGSKDPKQRFRSGGTNPVERQEILRKHGVESELHPQEDMGGMAQAVADGHGVITSHNGGILWNDTAYLGSGHSVLLSGINYNANGEIESVTVVDTGTGNCASVIPIARFKKSMEGYPWANVTKEPM
jgi:uncharacterized Zn-binding protein involved in type VI secretion